MYFGFTPSSIFLSMKVLVLRMIDKESLQKEVDELEKLASDVEIKGIKLITDAPKTSERKYASATKKDYYVYRWKELPQELEALQRELTRNYQRWYSSAHPLISKYIPEREAEFKGHYDSVLKEIQLRGNPFRTSDMIEFFVKEFEIQRGIFLSIPSVARIKELIK